MLKPSDIEQLKGDNSRYAMVVAVAKRARDIADHAIEQGEIIIEKPVSLAIEDFKSGEYKAFARVTEEDEEAVASEE